MQIKQATRNIRRKNNCLSLNRYLCQIIRPPDILLNRYLCQIIRPPDIP